MTMGMSASQPYFQPKLWPKLMRKRGHHRWSMSQTTKTINPEKSSPRYCPQTRRISFNSSFLTSSRTRTLTESHQRIRATSSVLLVFCPNGLAVPIQRTIAVATFVGILPLRRQTFILTLHIFRSHLTSLCFAVRYCLQILQKSQHPLRDL